MSRFGWLALLSPLIVSLQGPQLGITPGYDVKELKDSDGPIY